MSSFPVIFRKRGIAVPTFNFNMSAATFAAKMAKRTAPGPFDTAPIIQGKFDASGTCDGLSYPRGAQISSNFYGNFDPYQGTLIGWWVPEQDRTTSGVADQYLWWGSSTYSVRYEHDNNRLRATLGGQTLNKAAFSIVAGTAYFVSISWDVNNTIDGTNYIRISIDDTHTYGISSQPSVAAPAANASVGSAGAQLPLNGIAEGLTLYRRVLFDGTYGTDLGNGDEINLIYAAGAGKKPEEVTGGDDIVFALPTNGTAEELSTGTGEAHSFPWASNELANWHMQNETGGAPDNWTAVNAPTLANAATADILYGLRSQKMSVDAADEGIKQAFAVSAGEDFIVRATVKTGGAAQGVDLRVRDATGAADIVELTTDSSDYTVLETCFEVPAGCTSVEVFIESTDADSYDIHLAQVQVHANLVDNGGMEGVYNDESGGGGGTIDLAPGWDEFNTEKDGSDELSESADAHSGSASQKINVDTSNEGIISSANCFTANKWHLVTVWLKGTSGDARLLDHAAAFFDETITTPAATWTKYSWIVYATGAQRLRIIAQNAAANFLVDDISVIELDDVSITATAASEANSAEGTGIRVDGLDTLVSFPISIFKLDSW